MEQRKNEVRNEQIAQLNNMPDPDQPPGHRKLGNEEKEKTLNLLLEGIFLLLLSLNTYYRIKINFDFIKLKKNYYQK